MEKNRSLRPARAHNGCIRTDLRLTVIWKVKFIISTAALGVSVGALVPAVDVAGQSA